MAIYRYLANEWPYIDTIYKKTKPCFCVKANHPNPFCNFIYQIIHSIDLRLRKIVHFRKLKPSIF